MTRVAIGLAIVVANVVAFAMLARSVRTELAVELHGGRSGSANIDRAVVAAEPDAPGLRRTRWQIGRAHV